MECKREVLSNISLYKGLGGKGDADECYHTGCYCGCSKRLQENTFQVDPEFGKDVLVTYNLSRISNVP